MEQNIIERPVYTQRIVPFIGKGLIKVLTGQRRVGKSCVLIQCRNHILHNDRKANIIFINMEDMAFHALRTDEALYEYVKKHLKKGKNNYLFIDEVQNVSGFENVLRSFAANSECDIFVTGSNAKMLSGDLATYLAGRYVEFRIDPLSYGEFLLFHNLTDNDESLLKYLEFGGMPQLAGMPLSRDFSFNYLRDVYSTILLKDVIEREKVRDTVFLENLSFFLADNIGSIFSANSIAEYLKAQRVAVTNSVVLNHLRSLCNAFIVNKVRRYDIQGKKIFETNDKYYFSDTGIRNCIGGLDMTKDIGKLAENAVYNHLLRNRFEIFVGKNKDKEIDFYCRKVDKKIYVQVAFRIQDEKTYEREFGNLLAIKDNHPKYVVSTDPLLPESDSSGISFCPLRKFLLKEEF